MRALELLTVRCGGVTSDCNCVCLHGVMLATRIPVVLRENSMRYPLPRLANPCVRSTLVGVLTAGALLSGAGQAQAQGSNLSRPATPTIIGQINAAISRATGTARSASSIADPVKRLNELQGRRAAIAKAAASSAARDKASKLLDRILGRTKIERDKLLPGLRTFANNPRLTRDGRLMPANFNNDRLPLEKIIDQELEKAKKTRFKDHRERRKALPGKYAANYKKALVDFAIRNPDKLGETLGALSGGDNGPLLQHGPKWAAAAFGKVVGDYLEASGEGIAAGMWRKIIVRKAGLGRQVLIALNQGKPEQALDLLKADAVKEAKSASRAIIKGTINWVFDAGNGTPKLGDFVPLSTKNAAAVLGSAAGITPGDIYLKLIDAEIKFAKWASRHIKDTVDNVCLDQARKAYDKNNPGSFPIASDDFQRCLIDPGIRTKFGLPVRMNSFTEFENLARSVGLDYDKMMVRYLRERLDGKTLDRPVEWINKKIVRQRKAINSQFIKPLITGEKFMAAVAGTGGKAANNRIAELASALLNERQWEALASELERLEKSINGTMAAIQKDLAKAIKYSDGVIAAQKSFRKQEEIAAKAYIAAYNLAVQLRSLQIRILDIDPRACGKAGAGPSGSTGQAAAGIGANNLQQRFASLSDAVCKAPGAIANAADKSAGRQLLEDAIANVRKIRDLAKDVAKTATDMTATDKDAHTAQSGAPATGGNAKILAAANALLSDLKRIEGQYAKAMADFHSAHQTMQRNVTTIVRLQPLLDADLKKLKDCITPLTKAPIATKPRQLCAELSRRISDVNDDYPLNSWNRKIGHILFALNLPGHTAYGWKRKTLPSLILKPSDLRGELEAAKRQCEPAAPAAPTDAQKQKGQKSRQAARDAFLGAYAKARSQGDICLAKAVQRYRDVWISGKTALAAPSCNFAANRRALADAQQAAAKGNQGASDYLKKHRLTFQIVEQIHDALRDARAAFTAGNLDQAQSAVNGTSALIALLPSGIDCTQPIKIVTDAIAAARNAFGIAGTSPSGGEELARIKAQARAAAKACRPQELAKIGGSYQGTRDSELNGLLNLAGKMSNVRQNYARGRTQLLNGNLGSASSYWRRVVSDAASLPNSYCSRFATLASNGQRRIAEMESSARSARSAVSSCNVSQIDNWSAKLASEGNPYFNSIKSDLRGAKLRCAARQRDAAERRCKASFGPNSIPANPDGGSPSCSCRSGYDWNQDRSRCVAKLTREQVIADCKVKYGRRFTRVMYQNRRWVCRFCKTEDWEALPGVVGRCRRTREWTVRACQKKYKDQYSRVVLGSDNKWKCRFCKDGTYADGKGACKSRWGTSSGANTPPPSGFTGPTRTGACNGRYKAGGNRPEQVVINLGGRAGQVQFTREMYPIKDHMIVYVNGRTVVNTSCTGGKRTHTFYVPAGASQARVVVQPNCAGSTQRTSWNFRITCPR